MESVVCGRLEMVPCGLRGEVSVATLKKSKKAEWLDWRCPVHLKRKEAAAVEAEGMATGMGGTSPLRCGYRECGRRLRKGTNLECKMCRLKVHVGCGGTSSRALREKWKADGWCCRICAALGVRGAEPSRAEVESGGAEAVQRLVLEGGKRPVILQWNCDALMSKIPELSQLLAREGVAVAALQETKLREEDVVPDVPGYRLVRRDRRRDKARGGGVAFLVRSDLPFRVVYSSGDVSGEEVEAELEVLGIEVFWQPQYSTRLYCFYAPPCRSGVDRAGEALRLLPEDDAGFWLGDVNAHSMSWDAHVEGDARGELVEEWLCDREVVLLNDGSFTRRGRGTGVLSAPDITVCSTKLAQEWGPAWSTAQTLDSDHVPIIIRGGYRVDIGQVEEGRLVWNWKEADWPRYQAMVELRMAAVGWNGPVTEVERECRGAILEAAYACIGLSKTRGVRTAKLSKEAKGAVETRDEARWVAGAGEEEILRLETEARNIILEDKKAEWREVIRSNNAAEKVWKLLAQGKAQGAPAEVLSVDGKKYVTLADKASAFAKAYAKVSRLQIGKEERKMKKAVNARLRDGGRSGGEEGAELTLEEVKVALEEMDGNKAPGPDKVHPRLLKNLPASCVEAVWRLFKRSWVEARVRQNWRTGEIVPLLKENQDPEKVESYRPICLTATLGKWMERVVANRLKFVFESRGLLAEEQAGFRAGRTTTDQVLALSQDVSDGFQERKRTVLVTLDYAKAFDTVWRDGLLWKLVEMGVDARLVRWVQEWLVNRQAWVRLGAERGKAVQIKQGLPQGAVLSPLLFLAYINDVVRELPEGVACRLFADDLALWCSDRSVEAAARILQEALDRTVGWSRKWLLRLNARKCEVGVFSMDAADSGKDPGLTLDGVVLKKVEYPKYLGVVFDGRLTFNEHVSRCIAQARRRIHLLRRLSHVEWGMDQEIIRMAYVGLVRPVLEYATPAWRPWISRTCAERLEKCQRAAARMVAGLLSSSPAEAVLQEAGVTELAARGKAMCTALYDQYLRLAEGSSRRSMAVKVVRKRLRRAGWREICEEEWRGFFEERPTAGSVETVPPWKRRATLRCKVEAKKCSSEEDREEGLRRLAAARADFMCYTDGLVSPLGAGGAGVLILQGEDVVAEARLAAGMGASSTQAEVTAIAWALRWLRDRPGWDTATIACDSTAAIGAIARPFHPRQSKEEKEAKISLAGMEGKRVDVVWVPSHCGIPGNERADVLAAEGAVLEEAGGRGGGWSTQAAKGRIWREATRKTSWQHRRSEETYARGKRDWTTERRWTKAERVDYARFRVGHHLELG